MTESSVDPERIAAAIRRAASNAKTEEDLKIAVQRLLDDALRELAIDVQAEYEKTVYRSRRADAVYPAVVLEYKRPGSLRSGQTRRRAEEELTDYLQGLSKGDSLSRKLIGVAIDGESLFYVRARPSSAPNVTRFQRTLEGGRSSIRRDVQTSGLKEITGPVVEELLRYFQSLARRFLSGEALARDFGSQSEIARLAVPHLLRILKRNPSPRTATLFDEWNRLFGIIYGKEVLATEQGSRELRELYGLGQGEDLKRVLFSIHTYFALLMKLIAAEVLARQGGAMFSSFALECSTKSNEQLKEAFQDLEVGGPFRRLEINNFLEGDFFSWYVEAWDDQIAEAARKITRTLADYETATASLEPTETRDLLKHLYQFLVPKSIRHNLGEYYTPDWVADLVLNEADYQGDPDQRVLDPACGSGTFLALAIGRVLRQADDYPERIRRDTVLQAILSNIVGFDINPVAVLAARTNYLLAISTLRRTGPIEIPVYLCDSVLTPERTKTVYGASFSVRTTVGIFRLPQALSAKGRLDQVLGLLDQVLAVKGSKETFLKRARGIFTSDEFAAGEGLLTDLFERLEGLERAGRNRIWTRILKNAFAPLYLGRYDFVVGNPPWINWEFLSDDYREASAKLWERYGMLAKKSGDQFELGKQKRDFSQLFTVVCSRNYLRPGGRLGFVITQTVFKSEGGDVFRQFSYANSELLRPIRALDLVALKPFEGAANRTAIEVLQRGSPAVYPVPYFEYRMKRGGRVGFDDPLDKVLRETEVLKLVAIPVAAADPSSSWLTLTPEALGPVSKISGRSALRAYAGTTTWLNGVYWVSLTGASGPKSVGIRNLGTVGKSHVEVLDTTVETDLLYPLLRGRDVRRWIAVPSAYIILPHSAKTGWEALPINVMESEYPKTYSYLYRFKAQLLRRSGYSQLRQGHPFYIMGSTGSHTFSKHKVVWRGMSQTMGAAVIGEVLDGVLGPRMVVPDHSVMFINCDSADEAHYLAAILNSTPANCMISHYTALGIYTKVTEHLAIPSFDSRNDLHRAIAGIGKRAADAATSQKALVGIERDLDSQIKRLWGLTASDLRALHRDLTLVTRASASEGSPKRSGSGDEG